MKRQNAWVASGLESLEGRTLLSVVVGPRGHVAEVDSIHIEKKPKPTTKTQVVQGAIAGTLSPLAPNGASVANTLITGSGQITKGPVPHVSLQLSGTLTSGLKGRRIVASNGFGAFSVPGAFDGSAFVISFSGSSNVVKGNTQSLPIRGSFNGTGGVYAGLQGTISGTVKIDAVTQGFTLSFSLTYKAPKV